MGQESDTEGEEKTRRDEHFERQKALLASGDYSDIRVTCGDQMWNVHKAIICPQSGFFARAVKFGKEKDESTIDLPEDDPEIIRLMLDFLYTLDYDAHDDSDTDDRHSVSLWFAWSESDSLTRSERRKLQEGLFQMNDEGMQKAILATNVTFPNLKESGRRFLHVHSSEIQSAYINTISSILEDTTSTSGEKFYAQDYEDSAPIHAKLYYIGDKYHIPGLQKLALTRLKKDIENRSLDDSVVTKSLHILMDNTPEEDEKARMLVAQYLHRDMHRFGIRARNQGFFQKYPDMYEHCLRHQFGDGTKGSSE
ncbi:hypothetical protein K458DRAFT_351773 [Lentithecium fluviatile CBS 122367]|uniref:BTB domain-containing protein n=1 Tax=Lentithecium fluviatile CBS 122367 TaxID=1168545 RepID=A0A6G1IE65_9PLEO|nr:hypothetical protein K458DRAFT_351773 [Lentithecium fluviatile CBS 122367]